MVCSSVCCEEVSVGEYVSVSVGSVMDLVVLEYGFDVGGWIIGLELYQVFRIRIANDVVCGRIIKLRKGQCLCAE